MCLVNLVPASNDTWGKLTVKNNNDSVHHVQSKSQNSAKHMRHTTYLFPWSEFIMLLGFTAIFVIEVLEGGRNIEESNSITQNDEAGNLNSKQWLYYLNRSLIHMT